MHICSMDDIVYQARSLYHVSELSDHLHMNIGISSFPFVLHNSRKGGMTL